MDHSVVPIALEKLDLGSDWGKLFWLDSGTEELCYESKVERYSQEFSKFARRTVE